MRPFIVSSSKHAARGSQQAIQERIGNYLNWWLSRHKEIWCQGQVGRNLAAVRPSMYSMGLLEDTYKYLVSNLQYTIHHTPRPVGACVCGKERLLRRLSRFSLGTGSKHLGRVLGDPGHGIVLRPFRVLPPPPLNLKPYPVKPSDHKRVRLCIKWIKSPTFQPLQRQRDCNVECGPQATTQWDCSV